MASDTDSARNDESDLALTWSGRWTLSYRILAVNILTIVLIALAIVYLDAYRNRLETERVAPGRAGSALGGDRDHGGRPGAARGAARRLVAVEREPAAALCPRRPLALDSWRRTGPTYRLRDPATQSWNKDAARALDRAFNALVGEESRDDFVEPARGPRRGVAGSARRARHRTRSSPTSARRPN